jgi:hypothetical protein
VAAGAKITSQLFRQLLLALDPLAITRRCEPHYLLASEWRTAVNGQQLTQLIELKNALAGILYGTGRAHRLGFYGTGATDRSACFGRRDFEFDPPAYSAGAEAFTSYLPLAACCDYRFQPLGR